MSCGLPLDSGQESYLRRDIAGDDRFAQYYEPVELRPGAFLGFGEQARQIGLRDVKQERATTPGRIHQVSKRGKPAELAHAEFGATRRDENERPPVRRESNLAHTAASADDVGQPGPALYTEGSVGARRTGHRVYEHGARPVASHHFRDLDGRWASQVAAGRPAHKDDPARRSRQPCRRPRA